MKTKLYFKKLGLVAMMACPLAACMDGRYDLNDVDMNIGTSGDLTLPGSSTGDILLSSILDVTEDGIVQVVDGQYYLVETGNANVPDIDIAPIAINRPVLSEMSITVNADGEGSPVFAPAMAKVAKGALTDLPHVAYTYSIQPDGSACCEFADNVVGNVPNQVVSLNEVAFADDTRLDMQLVASFDKGYDFVNLIHLEQTTLAIPSGMYVESATMRYWTMKSGNVQEVIAPVHSIDNENGLIQLINAESDYAVMIGDGYDIRVSLEFNKAVTGDCDIVFDNHQISLHGKFEIGGKFRIESKEFDAGKFTPEQENAILASGSYDAVKPKFLNLRGVSSFNQDIHIASFSGRVQTSVEDITPISLDDLPDFLNDPDVVLDLVSPAFYVEVFNPLSADVTTSLTLTSKYTDSTPAIERRSGNIVLPAASRCVVRVAENFDNLVMPEKYHGLSVVDVRIADLGGLLEKLPEAIEVEVDDIVADVTSMSVPQSGTDIYKVDVDYMIYTPLEFGEDTKLIYQGVEEGLADDLEDVNKLDTKAIEIKAVAESNFPLELILSVDAQDVNGKSLVGGIVTVDDVVINAHKGPEDVSCQDVKLTIKPVQGHTIRELLEQLDKFVYRAVAEGDGKLLENAYLKLTKIKITLKGGISYDAN